MARQPRKKRKFKKSKHRYKSLKLIIKVRVMKAAWIERKRDKKVRKIQKRDFMKKMIVKMM